MIISKSYQSPSSSQNIRYGLKCIGMYWERFGAHKTHRIYWEMVTIIVKELILIEMCWASERFGEQTHTQDRWEEKNVKLFPSSSSSSSAPLAWGTILASCTNGESRSRACCCSGKAESWGVALLAGGHHPQHLLGRAAHLERSTWKRSTARRLRSPWCWWRRRPWARPPCPRWRWWAPPCGWSGPAPAVFTWSPCPDGSWSTTPKLRQISPVLSSTRGMLNPLSEVAANSLAKGIISKKCSSPWRTCAPQQGQWRLRQGSNVLREWLRGPWGSWWTRARSRPAHKRIRWGGRWPWEPHRRPAQCSARWEWWSRSGGPLQPNKPGLWTWARHLPASLFSSKFSNGLEMGQPSSSRTKQKLTGLDWQVWLLSSKDLF